jgi:hypothetical protein
MRPYRRPENATSSFPEMGADMADNTVNASADEAAPLSVPRHRLSNGQFATRPLEYRAPVQVDAVTGQELNDAMQRTLAHYGDPRATTPAYQDHDENVAERRAGMSGAIARHDHRTPGAGDVLGRLLMPPSQPGRDFPAPTKDSPCQR